MSQPTAEEALVDAGGDPARGRAVAGRSSRSADRGVRGYRRSMNRERDPANPTPEELRETAASEGLMASEEETDPEFEDDRDPEDVPDPEMG
jgi:hypothetical protein